MPKILPISDLRNNFNRISEICHQNDEPVYITKNGKGDMVVTSISYFEKLQAKLALYGKLGEAEDDIRNGRTISHEDLMTKVKDRYRA